MHLKFYFALNTFLLVGLFCLTGQLVAQESKPKKSYEDRTLEVAMILKDQTEAWNRGDLEGFMETYWKSDGLTFCGGGKTTRGWQATLDNYKKGYAPPKEMGHLHFDKLNVMLIESKSALVIGDWHLKMKDDSKKDGNFSLVVKKIKGKWKIIHDHSSTLEKPEVKEKENQIESGVGDSDKK